MRFHSYRGVMRAGALVKFRTIDGNLLRLTLVDKAHWLQTIDSLSGKWLQWCG